MEPCPPSSESRETNEEEHQEEEEEEATGEHDDNQEEEEEEEEDDGEVEDQINNFLSRETTFVGAVDDPDPSRTLTIRQLIYRRIIDLDIAHWEDGQESTYLCFSYLDRFLQKRSIKIPEPWALDLLAVVFRTVAAKVHDQTSVHALKETMHLSHRYYSPGVVARTELLVLEALEWDVLTVTPIHYLEYLACRLHGDLSDKEMDDLLEYALEHVGQTCFVRGMVDLRPSAVAVAAMALAAEREVTEDSVVFQWGPKEFEEVLDCYNIIKNSKGRQEGRPRG